jgi:hypothetical protein
VSDKVRENLPLRKRQSCDATDYLHEDYAREQHSASSPTWFRKKTVDRVLNIAHAKPGVHPASTVRSLDSFTCILSELRLNDWVANTDVHPMKKCRSIFAAAVLLGASGCMTTNYVIDKAQLREHKDAQGHTEETAEKPGWLWLTPLAAAFDVVTLPVQFGYGIYALFTYKDCP